MVIMYISINLHATIISVATGVCVFHCLYNPFLHWLATHKYAPVNSFIRESAGPLVAGALAAIPCICLQLNLPAGVWGDIGAIGGGGLIFFAAYLFVSYLLVSESLYDLLHQLAPFWNRLRAGGQAAGDTRPRNGVTT